LLTMTRAPQAEANLIAALTAAPAFAGVGIAASPMTDADQQAENLYLVDTSFSEDWRGINCRDDDFTITLVILIRKIQSQAVTKQRAWTLALAVGAVLDTDPFLGGVLNEAAWVGSGNVKVYPAGPDGAWEAEARLQVRGLAVING
jgi:hypothetical protein